MRNNQFIIGRVCHTWPTQLFAQLSVLTTASVVLFNHHDDKSLSSDGVTNVIAPIDLNLGPVGNTSQRTFEILTTRCKKACKGEVK